MTAKCKVCTTCKNEDIDYINNHLKKGDLSVRDLTRFLETNYPSGSPWYPSTFKTHKTHMDKLYSEELIAQAAEKGEIIPDNVFTKREKIGSAESYEKLISEYWLNYRALNKPGSDLAKKGYLDSIAKLLEQLSKEKVMEKDYLTQLNILKEKREHDSPAQRLDLIQGWFIPALLDKCKDNDEARGLLGKLQEYLFNLDAELNNGKDRSLVAKEGLTWLYDKQRGVK